MNITLSILIVVIAVTLSVGFAAGLLCKTITDGIGKWVADWLTDKRRRREKESQSQKSAQEIIVQMGSLFVDLRKNLNEHPVLRDVLLSPKNDCYNYPDPHIRFDEEGVAHHELLNKFRRLNELGLVSDISGEYLMAFRMTDDLVKLIMNG